MAKSKAPPSGKRTRAKKAAPAASKSKPGSKRTYDFGGLKRHKLESELKAYASY